MERPSDQVWISQQLENNVVRNYLDCGLGDFGIDLSSKIMQFEHPSKEEPELELSHPSEDEAIGDKFESAHLAVFNLGEETIL